MTRANPASMNGGRFDFSDGGSYCGGWEEGKAHGHGVCTGPQGKGEYSGTWHNGFEVSGVYMWPSGNTYEGNWENGRRHGLGVETKGRWIYRGEFTRGFKGKYGVIQSLSSGAKYEGTWGSGLQDGYGQETYADGGIYQGQWVGGMRHGYGIRNSVPYGMASIARPALRTSLTSLRSEQENGSVASAPTENFGQRGGFVLDVSEDGQSDIESVRTAGSLGRKDPKRSSGRHFISSWKARKKKGKGDHHNTDTPVGSVSSLRAHLFHQDSIRSNESTFSSGSVQSSNYDGDSSPLHEEDPSIDVTEVYMGEWKQDKRAGYGHSQRSDGYQYMGEWHGNKRHGYGAFTFPDGHREEGKWKNNVLVSSGKKKMFVMGGKKVTDRVEKAVELAQQAANLARAKADLAISRGAYAKEKAEMAIAVASESREESIKAKVYTKELTATLPAKGGNSAKLDRKKSFFGRSIVSGFDRHKNKMKGTVVTQEGHFKLPSAHDRVAQGNGKSNEWDGRGVSPNKEAPIREAHSTGNLLEEGSGSRRRGNPPRQSSYAYEMEGRSKEVTPHVVRYDQQYVNFEHSFPRERYGGYDKGYNDSYAELTPDSGISTASDHDRSRPRLMLQKQRSIGKRQLGMHDTYDDYSHMEHPYEDEYFEDEQEIYSNTNFSDSRFDDEEEEERMKQQQRQKRKAKYSERQASVKSDVPPGHYRTFQGSFTKGCRIKYIPRAESMEEKGKEEEFSDDTLAVQKKKHWSASKGLIFLVLVLNIGFTVLFTSLFLQMEEEGKWDNWP